MERRIRPGDYVAVSYKEELRLYSIKDITPEGIYATLISDPNQQVLLIYTDAGVGGKWAISGTSVFPRAKYTIEFQSKELMPQLLFTKTPEIDIQILNELDDKTLRLACQLDKYTQSLCQKDGLWKQRVIKYFGDKVSLEEPPAVKVTHFGGLLTGESLYIMFEPLSNFIVISPVLYPKVIGYFDGRRINPLTPEQIQMIRQLELKYDPITPGYVTGIPPWPTIPEFTTEELSGVLPEGSFSSYRFGGNTSRLSIIVNPPINFIINDLDSLKFQEPGKRFPERPTVIGYFDGGGIRPLTEEQIRIVDQMRFNHDPTALPDMMSKVPDEIGGFITPFQPISLNIQPLRPELIKNRGQTWKQFYTRVSRYFNQVWIVLSTESDIPDILGIYKTKEEAVDKIIDKIKRFFSTDELGRLGYQYEEDFFSPVDELKDDIFKNDGMESQDDLGGHGDMLYIIKGMSRNEIPV